ncbi:major facilitator superfamily domain-containing protein [Ilyonectria destructans]|nr:major facilitator superfamily domain-containing protein [Ilyonectria destructans]
MPTIRKWVIVIIVCATTVCVTCTSSIYTTTYAQIEHELAATRLTSAAGLSTFVLGIAFGPLFTGPLSEHYGRRPIYLISWSMFVILTIPSAVATKMEMLIVTRFFDGFAGSTFLSVAGGTVGDIFLRDELQKPMVFVSLAPFVGPSLGPLLGGFINSSLHWRWTYYIIIIWAVVLLLAIALLVPETLHSVILLKKAQKLRTETGEHRYWAPAEKAQGSNRKIVALALRRPFQLLLLEPMCFILDLYSAILLGILYLVFGAFPAVFRTTYGMNLWQSCLTFLGIIVGMLAGAATNSVWDKIRRHLIDERERSSGETGVIGGVLIPIGLFWFSWTTHITIHWLVPVIGSSFFGCGVEAYAQYAASALAANGFARAFLAAAFPLIQIPMYDKLGYQWGTSVLAFLTVAMMPFPWLFFKYGKTLRLKSRFATNLR